MAERVGLEPRAGWQRCPGSKTEQMLAWAPDPSTDYPGAVVCLSCSFGVMVYKSSVTPATSVSGHQGSAGKVRVHKVRQIAVSPDRGPHPFEAVEMEYGS